MLLFVSGKALSWLSFHPARSLISNNVHATRTDCSTPSASLSSCDRSRVSSQQKSLRKTARLSAIGRRLVAQTHPKNKAKKFTLRMSAWAFQECVAGGMQLLVNVGHLHCFVDGCGLKVGGYRYSQQHKHH